MQFCSVYDLPRLCLVLMLSVCSAADLQWGPWTQCRGWDAMVVFCELESPSLHCPCVHFTISPWDGWSWVLVEMRDKQQMRMVVGGQLCQLWWTVAWTRDTRMVVSWCGWWRVEECELGCYLSTVPISRHSPAATSPANTRTLSNTGPGFCDEISTFLKLTLSSHVNFFWCLALCLDNCFRLCRINAVKKSDPYSINICSVTVSQLLNGDDKNFWFYGHILFSGTPKNYR